VRRLKVRSVLLDGEGVVYDAKGMPSFDLIHSIEYDREVSLAAFDLLELDSADGRKHTLIDRKKAPRQITRAGEGWDRIQRAYRRRRPSDLRARLHGPVLVAKSTSRQTNPTLR
jgi:ATP-dependent DNA ligase